MPPDESSGSTEPELSESAQEVDALIRQGVDSFVDLDEFSRAGQPAGRGAPPTPPPATGPAPVPPTAAEKELGIAVAIETIRADGQADTEGSLWSRMMRHEHRVLAITLLLIAAAALGALVLAWVMAYLRADGAGASATPPAAAVAGGVPVTATAPPASAGAGAATPADCLVAPSDISVTTKVTFEDRGVADPAMFVKQWDTVVENLSQQPIVVTVRISSSAGAPGGAWDGSYQGLQPGATASWQASVDNNAGGQAGAVNYTVPDRVIAVRDAGGCGDLLVAPSGEVAAAAQQFAIPDLPAGVSIPG